MITLSTHIKINTLNTRIQMNTSSIHTN